eukprot:Skav234369  [mRNA]  locus=scaffold2071:40230:43653:+ [translate_table: standard]
MVKHWSSSIFHEPQPDGRLRDPFPLPRLKVQGVADDGLCRTTCRRVLRRGHVALMTNRVIDSLNSLFFGGMNYSNAQEVVCLDSLPLIQGMAIRDIITAVKRLGVGPPADNSGASKALRVAASGYFGSEASVGDVVSLDFNCLSLPSVGTAGVDLLAALDEPIRGVVQDFEDRMLQDDLTWTAISRDSSHLKPYNDPSLNDRGKYLSFLKLLHDRGVLSFSNRCRGRVGAFTVSKKDKMIDGTLHKRQRLVLDCRQTNQLFKPSPHTTLGSLASLAEMELKEGTNLYMSGADIQDCFYAVHIPPAMQEFFCLAFDVTGPEAAMISGLGEDSFQHNMCSPCVSVLPMGFSWSFYLVQQIHQQSVQRSLAISDEALFLDNQPVPNLLEHKVASMPYCDNIHCISVDKKLCDDAKNKVINDLTELGFSIHEEEDAATSFFTLGGEVDGEAGQIRMTAERAWDLIRAFEYAATHVISPTVMQKLLGHAMFFSTLHRGGMSVFRSCYDFVEKGGDPRMLNRRERHECMVFSGLIPLLFASIRRPWSDDIFCTDASPEGFGVCQRHLGSQAVGSLGRWSERWRYRRLAPDEWAPRRGAMGLDPLVDAETVLGCGDPHIDGNDFVLDDDFPEVPVDVVRPSDWSTVLMGKWRSGEHITLKEGRAVVLCLRRMVRSSRHRNKRRVILVDNLGLALCISKGRATDFKMLRGSPKKAARYKGKKPPGPLPVQEKLPSKKRGLPMDVVRKQPKAMRTVGCMKESEVDGIGKRAQTNRLTVLEQKSISSEVRHQYLGYLMKFESFCRASGLKWPLAKDVDAVLADFLDVMFLDNRSAAEGEKVVAAVEFHDVKLKGQLTRSKRALRGWRKERPPQSRLPLPRLVAAGMAMILASQGLRSMALKVMLDHDTYMRPGESIDIKCKDVIPPVAGAGKQYRWYGIVIRDIADMKPDKAGIYDNTIALNSPGREFLGEVLWQLVIQSKKSSEYVFQFTAAEFRKKFQMAGEKLSLKNLHPYQCRHGGASEDLNSGDRDFQRVKIRGRWHTAQSVRRYAKIGKIQKLMVQLSPSHLEFCRWSLKNMEKVLRGQMAPRVP